MNICEFKMHMNAKTRSGQPTFGVLVNNSALIEDINGAIKWAHHDGEYWREGFYKPLESNKSDTLKDPPKRLYVNK